MTVCHVARGRGCLWTLTGAVAAFWILGGLASAAELPLLKPDSGPWDAGSGFSFDKKQKDTRQSVSGIACPEKASGPRMCLVVFDEGVEARYAIVNDNSYTVDGERIILGSSGELDAEGAATDGRYFYVTGSHSPKRKDCASNPASRHVTRFARDPATGRALRNPVGDPKGALVQHKDTGRLWTMMGSLPQLKDHVGDGKCLGSEPPGQRGANIEGLAIKDGRLFFGFRGPSRDGITLIVSVDADAFFDGKDPNTEVTPIKVGDRRGIRDLQAVRDGILLLAGPDDDDSSAGAGWMVALWDGKAAGEKPIEPRGLARLDLSEVKRRECDKQKLNDLKPEAMTVLEDTAARYRVLILSDGMCDGGPLVFSIQR